ncbi:MAG: VWA domain-containing protein, partial [Candidatus Bipolaricaulia bacterium]
MIRFSQPLFLLLLHALGPLLWEITRRPRAAIVLRGLALVLVVLALAGPEFGSRVRENYIYFVVDLSGSISQSQEELLELVGSLAVEREHLRYGLILFGAEAAIDQGFNHKLDLENFSTVVPREGTDIAAALSLALASFPQQGEKRVVLLTDGRPTRGDIQQQLARATYEGVRIAVRPLRPRLGEVWLESLSLPEEAPQGEQFEVKLSVGALGAAEARLLLYRDGQFREAKQLSLSPGLNGIQIRDGIQETGLHRYRASLVADHDTILENNDLEALITIGNGPQVLLLQDDGGGEALAGLLKAAGYSYVRTPLDGFVWDLPRLSGYRLVVLDNLKLAPLSDSALEALEGYVQGGGGLLVIQGRKAVEGLRRTELEKILPVSYEGREPAQAPSLAIAFVLDRSSSMTGKKIGPLKEAAAASVEVLDEQDLIGLLAFDTEYEWIVPIQPAGDKGWIYRQIAALQANGGTDLLPALTEAFRSLSRVEAKLKHIVVFSDGKALLHELQFPKLLEQIRAERITLSAIAIGEGANAEFLGGLAEQGGGRLYQVKDPEELPRVTLRETERAARQRWIAGQTKVVPGPYAHLLGERTTVPDLGGYVVTYPKAASQMALLSERADPLVGFWSYGLGRVGVINTDFEGPWSSDWIGWAGLSELFMRIVGQALGRPRDGEISVDTELEGTKL